MKTPHAERAGEGKKGYERKASSYDSTAILAPSIQKMLATPVRAPARYETLDHTGPQTLTDPALDEDGSTSPLAFHETECEREAIAQC